MTNLRVSVCLAMHNGSEYIDAQMTSIISQLRDFDELIVVDDFSTDNSLARICAIDDHRIRVFRNDSNVGVVKSFERAIANASGDIVFFSDQDDVWSENKISRTLEVFEHTGALCILSDALLVNGQNESLGKTFFEWRHSRPGLIRNWLRNSFMGCTMAFRRELISVAVPFPSSIYMHDQWLGLLATAAGRVVFLDEPLIRYRRHGNNVTSMKRSGVWTMLRRRLSFAASLVLRMPRALQLRRTGRYFSA